MKRLLICAVFVFLLSIPCNAAEFVAPEAPKEAQRYLPDSTENFGEGLHYVLLEALRTITPDIAQAAKTCISVIAVVLSSSLICNLPGNHTPPVTFAVISLVGIMLLGPSNSSIRLGIETTTQIAQYGKLLMPVLSSALAAQGGINKSGMLFAATVFVNALLSTAITELLTPLIYIFLCLSLVSGFMDQSLLKSIKDTVKKAIIWGLRTVIYVFTGYISISGVMAGSADAAVLKATKLTISSMVPVVGGILSDASEAVLVSAGLMKNAAGVYGMLAMIAAGIGPFLRIGIQMLFLKISTGICHMFSVPKVSGVIKDFADTMGLVLAMLGTVCVILLISTMAFMRGSG